MRAYSFFTLAVVAVACGRSDLDWVANVDAPSESITESESATDTDTGTETESAVDTAPDAKPKCTGTWSFAPAVVYNDAPGAPFAIAVGDFNGDGHPDLAVANYDPSGSVDILLNQGDGTFGLPATYAVGASPESIAIGDFDADGHPDLVVTNINDNTVSVLFNRGDGSFRAQVTFAGGSGPDSVAVGDFDRDGALDFAVAESGDSPDNLYVFFAAAPNEDASFLFAPVTYAVVYWPSSLVVADFNRDGAPDLAYANQGQGNVAVMLNEGTGTFGIGTAYTEIADADTGSIAVGDFNGDGSPDIVAANDFAPGNVVVMLNEAATFATQVTYATGAPPAIVGNYGGSVAVGDFNADHHPDIAVANNSATNIGVLLNDGTGLFVGGATYAAGPLASDFAGIATGDLNGDGADDIVVAGGWSRNVTVLLSVCQ